jgi:protein-tyrosine phosphatase
MAAASRGLALSEANEGPISRHTSARLGDLGISIPEPIRQPLWLTEKDLLDAQLVVAMKTAEHRGMMDAHFPHWASLIEYWDIDDLDCAGPGVALPQIEAAVNLLLRRLSGLAAA